MSGHGEGGASGTTSPQGEVGSPPPRRAAAVPSGKVARPPQPPLSVTDSEDEQRANSPRNVRPPRTRTGFSRLDEEVPVLELVGDLSIPASDGEDMSGLPADHPHARGQRTDPRQYQRQHSEGRKAAVAPALGSGTALGMSNSRLQRLAASTEGQHVSAQVPSYYWPEPSTEAHLVDPLVEGRSSSFSLSMDYDAERVRAPAGGAAVAAPVHVAELLVGVVANMNEFSDPAEQANSSIFESFFDLTQARLQTIFSAFEGATQQGSSRGMLSYENFRRSLRDAGLEIKDKESFDRLAKKVDLDRDGMVSFNEFETVVQSLKMGHLFKYHPERNWSTAFRCVNYNAQRSQLQPVDSSSLKSFMYEPRPDWATHRWIELFLPAAFALKCLAIKHRLHPLALEDVLNDSGKSRAKVERFETHVFVVFPVLALVYDPKGHRGDRRTPQLSRRRSAHHGATANNIFGSRYSSFRSSAESPRYGPLGRTRSGGRVSSYGTVGEPFIQGPHGELHSPGTPDGNPLMRAHGGMEPIDLDSERDKHEDQHEGEGEEQQRSEDPDLAELNIPRVVKMNAYMFVAKPDLKTTICAVGEECQNLFQRVHRELGVSYSRLRQHDGMYLLYVLLDVISDSYSPLVTELEWLLVALSKRVRGGRHRTAIDEQSFSDAYHDLMIEANNLKRWVVPALRVIANLINDDSIDKDCRLYLQDVKDHLEQTADDISSLLEGLRALKDEHETQLAQRMNQAIFLLTTGAACALPLQVLSGIFGMNLPEVQIKYGYIIFWVCK